MLAIKKIGRVARIKWKRLESRKRAKHARSPFPSVAEQVVYAESALSCGIRVYRSRIPIRKIEISALPARFNVAPRIRAFAFRRRAVSGAMPLGFARQTLIFPSRKRVRFRMTHVNGRIKRQRKFLEHSPVAPIRAARIIAIAVPKKWMRKVHASFPGPVFRAPQLLFLVSA